MLQDAQLHHKFWEDAIGTANYIHNRLPHKGNNNKVPFEVLYNKKVDYSKLRVFGCQAFYFIPKQFRDKFANSTFSGIFLGYDTNPSAYRIYDPSNNKIILSKAVVFFEDYPANLSAPSSPPDIYNFLPYNEIGGSMDDDNLSEDFNNINNNNNNNINNTFNNNNNIDNTFNNNNNYNNINNNNFIKENKENYNYNNNFEYINNLNNLDQNNLNKNLIYPDQYINNNINQYNLNPNNKLNFQNDQYKNKSENFYYLPLNYRKRTYKLVFKITTLYILIYCRK